MAVQTIAYDDKSYLNQNANIPNVNKVTDSDMNEIKSVVNNNAYELIGLGGQFADYVIEEGGDFSTNLYMKLANGIMIQWGRIQVTSAIQTAIGSLYRTSGVVTKNLVEEFANTSYILTTNAKSALNSYYLVSQGTDNFTGYPIAYESTSAATRYIDFIAIGRWE